MMSNMLGGTHFRGRPSENGHAGDMTFVPRVNSLQHSSSRYSPRQVIDSYEGVDLIGERNGHTCPSCSRTFARAEHLERHLSVHLPTTTSRSFLCTYCSKGFTRKDVLTRHIRAVHEAKRTEQRKSRRKSCNRCARFKIKCAGGSRGFDNGPVASDACDACKKRGVSCVYDFFIPQNGEEEEAGLEKLANRHQGGTRLGQEPVSPTVSEEELMMRAKRRRMSSHNSLSSPEFKSGEVTSMSSLESVSGIHTGDSSLSLSMSRRSSSLGSMVAPHDLSPSASSLGRSSGNSPTSLKVKHRSPEMRHPGMSRDTLQSTASFSYGYGSDDRYFPRSRPSEEPHAYGANRVMYQSKKSRSPSPSATPRPRRSSLFSTSVLSSTYVTSSPAPSYSTLKSSRRSTDERNPRTITNPFMKPGIFAPESSSLPSNAPSRRASDFHGVRERHESISHSPSSHYSSASSASSSSALRRPTFSHQRTFSTPILPRSSPGYAARPPPMSRLDLEMTQSLTLPPLRQVLEGCSRFNHRVEGGHDHISRSVSPR
jgi:uncharacterized Zn-finger protein